MNHKAKCKRLNYKTHRSKHRNKSLWCWIRQWFLRYDTKSTRNNRGDWHLNFIRIKIFCTSKFNSVTQSCLTLWDPIDCSMPSLPVHHQLPELTQAHVHRFSDAIQPPHPLVSPSLPALNLSQHQGLFHWVSSSHQVAKVLEFQLQHQCFQWLFRTDFF